MHKLYLQLQRLQFPLIQSGVHVIENMKVLFLQKKMKVTYIASCSYSYASLWILNHTTTLFKQYEALLSTDLYSEVHDTLLRTPLK